MGNPGNILHLPHFIMAGSPSGLLRLMRRNNIRDGRQYAYFDISQTQDGRWIAWYYKTPTRPEEKRNLAKDVSNNGTR